MADAFDMHSLKSSFFDSERVLARVETGKRKALSKSGSYVRTRARSSLRYRKAGASPGSPPSVHRFAGFTRRKTNRKTGVVTRNVVSPLRELLYFAYDETSDSVVIGPEAFRNAYAGPGVAPRALEKGGDSVKPTPYGPKRISVRAFPFMLPALRAEAPNFPETFRGVVSS
jgi:hypothetical protein